MALHASLTLKGSKAPNTHTASKNALVFWFEHACIEFEMRFSVSSSRKAA